MLIYFGSTHTCYTKHAINYANMEHADVMEHATSMHMHTRLETQTQKPTIITTNLATYPATKKILK